MNELQRIQIFNAMTEFDKRASKRAGYNPYALGHMAQALQNASEYCDEGRTVRAALCKAFCGRLLDCVLKAIGEPAATKGDRRFN